MSCGIDVAIGGCALMQLHGILHPIAGHLITGAFWLGLLIGVRGAYLFRRLVREYDGIERGFAKHGGAYTGYLIDWHSPNIPNGFRKDVWRGMRRYTLPMFLCFAFSFVAWAYSTVPPPPPEATFLLRL